MSQSTESRLLRALGGQSPQSPASRRIMARATTRDLHPVHGSAAVLQAVSGGAPVKSSLSLNVVRADGSKGRAFCFGVPGFGWGQGEFA
jgi:hypothetical protein